MHKIFTADHFQIWKVRRQQILEECLHPSRCESTSLCAHARRNLCQVSTATSREHVVRATNDATKLATTVLSMMLKAAFGGPEFIAKMLPVAKLDSGFQYSQVLALMESVIKAEAEILAVIVDGNRVIEFQ